MIMKDYIAILHEVNEIKHRLSILNCENVFENREIHQLKNRLWELSLMVEGEVHAPKRCRGNKRDSCSIQEVPNLLVRPERNGSARQVSCRF